MIAVLENTNQLATSTCPLMIQIHPHPFTRNQMRLTTESWLPRPVSEVFEFFADAANLESITPPSLKFRIQTPQPIEMSTGTLIDYQLRLHWVPIRWQTEISVWEPPHRFVDRQLRGPYRIWEHTHTFKQVDDGTLVRDDVDYASPGGRVIERLLVRRDLRRIFEYRHQRLHSIFGECLDHSKVQVSRRQTEVEQSPSSIPPQ